MLSELKKINKQFKKEYFMKYLSSIIVRIAYLTIPIFYSYAIENITDGSYKRAVFLIIGLLVFIIIFYLSSIFNDWCYQNLYKKLYNKITKINLKYTDKNSIHSLSRISFSDYTNIMTSEVDVISDAYANKPMAVARILEIIFIIIYFFMINFTIGLIGTLMGIITILLLDRGNRKVNYINSQDKLTHVDRMGVIQEYYLGMKEVKGLRIYNTVHNRIEKNTNKFLLWHTDYGFNKSKLNFLSLGIIELSKIISLFYGLYLVSKGNITIAVILLVYNYYDKLVAEATGLLDFNDRLQNSKVCLKDLLKLEEYINKEKIESNTENTIKRGIIDFKNVVYGDKKDPILNNFNCHIPARGVTVISGRTGSGKTGIIDLLLKLNRQHEGTIEIDKIDINEYSDTIYFDFVAAVRKNPSFFHMSIRDNLSLIEPDFEKVVSVCNELEINDDILRLNDGYDTIITETASNISTNLKFMLSIARVVLKNPKVLLFDETLNAFPKEVDLKLLEYFKNSKGKHNVVIISKEKHVLEEADQVLYMEKGENIAFGRHEILLENNKKYKDFYNEL